MEELDRWAREDKGKQLKEPPEPMNQENLTGEAINIYGVKMPVQPQFYPTPSTLVGLDFEKDLEEFITTWGMSAMPYNISKAWEMNALKGLDFWKDFEQDGGWD